MSIIDYLKIEEILNSLPENSYIKLNDNISKSNKAYGENPMKSTYKGKLCKFDSIYESRVRIRREGEPTNDFRPDLEWWSFHIDDIDREYLLNIYFITKHKN